MEKEIRCPYCGKKDVMKSGIFIYILDYKPETHKTSPIKQLITYALSLASRIKLPVKDFKCT